jgi:hypothetical protein
MSFQERHQCPDVSEDFILSVNSATKFLCHANFSKRAALQIQRSLI